MINNGRSGVERNSGIRSGGRFGAISSSLMLFLILNIGCFGGSDRDPIRQNSNSRAQTPADALLTSHSRMVAALVKTSQSMSDSPYFGTKEARELKQQVDALGERAGGRYAFELLFAAGETHVHLGDLETGIACLKRAYDIIPTARLAPDEANHARFKLGVAYMRLGETENCCALNTPESCIVPIRGGGLHTRVQGSTEAIRCFQEVMNNTDENSRDHLTSRWLFNVAHMTLGGYPDKVPPDLLIPVQTFQSEAASFPRFANISEKAGLNTFNLSGGAIVDDFNNDGYLDVLTSTWDPDGQLHFLVNNADGTFSDNTANSHLLGLNGGLNLLQTDYDNDGNLDFLILRGAWLGRVGRHPNSLIHNNGDGTFTDVTFEAGLGDAHYPTQTAAWADYDNDGDIDLFVGNEYTKELKAPCQLFRNNNDGTFTDIAERAGVLNLGYSKGVTWGDFDHDRFPDLYVSNYTSENRLYKNNRDGTFTNEAEALGVARPVHSFPTWFWDFDNDGELDLFVSCYTGRVHHLAAHYLGQATDYERPCLYRGDGSGGFVNATSQQDLEYPMLPMGSNFGDLDNDGFLDFYLGTGDPDYESLMPNLMFLNRRGQGFKNVTMAGGFGHLQKGHGVAFADLDNDGDADVFEQMGGAYPGDKYADALYENPGFRNHWLGVHVLGAASNRAAIGVRIHAEIDEGGVTRSIYRHVNSGGSFGANPLRQTIGLGDADGVRKLSVFWPTTGRTQVFHDIGANQFVRVIEDEKTLTRIDLKKLKLGEAAQGLNSSSR